MATPKERTRSGLARAEVPRPSGWEDVSLRLLGDPDAPVRPPGRPPREELVPVKSPPAGAPQGKEVISLLICMSKRLPEDVTKPRDSA